ncbi:cytochrome P450 [Penicillium herquei]|nr:cytochrome P450 [Penicillium herquei]
MFSIRDPTTHQALRRPVAQKFSMSSIKSLEPFADECTKIFLDSMKDLEGQRVDLGAWLQWYAFDVIGAITFQQRFGFMEERKDVQSMIADLEVGLRYAGIVGQVPSLHSWMIGNIWVGKFLAMQPFVHAPDPLRTIVQASLALSPSPTLITDRSEVL